MFLRMPSDSDAAAALFARDRADDGYVMNATRLWAWRPEVAEAFVDVRKLLTERGSFSLRERSVLVCAVAAELHDSYCALAWGATLAAESSPTTAAAVLRREEAAELTAREHALAQWARQVVRDPNATTSRDVDALRAAGLSDEQIFDARVFVAFRLAFSTVNDALGARPDLQLAEAAPTAVRDAVAYGRPIALDASS